MNTRIHTDLTLTINLAAQGGASPFAGQPPVALVQLITLLDAPTGKQITQTQVSMPVVMEDITDTRLADINAVLAEVGLEATRLAPPQ